MGLYESKEAAPTYEGRVLRVFCREERVMSDVYADVSYAWVVEDDGAVREVYLRAHFECSASTAWAKEDAGPEWRAFAEAARAKALAGAEVAKAKKEVEAAEKANPVVEGRPYRRGDLAMVTGTVKGLTKGDILKVVWVGNSKFSGADRIGVETENGGKVYGSVTKFTMVRDADEDLALAKAAEEKLAKRRKVAAEVLAEAEAKLVAATEAWEAAKPTELAVAA